MRMVNTCINNLKHHLTQLGYKRDDKKDLQFYQIS